MNTDPKYTRLNITLPTSLVEDVKKIRSVTKISVSQLISDALREKITQQKRLAALQTIERSDPALPQIQDASSYIAESRAEDEERLEKLGI